MNTQVIRKHRNSKHCKRNVSEYCKHTAGCKTRPLRCWPKFFNDKSIFKTLKWIIVKEVNVKRLKMIFTAVVLGLFPSAVECCFCFFDRLMLSRQIGDLISGHCGCKVPCKCGCQALAQNVYTKLHLHHQAIICLLKQGRVHAGIEYAKHK